MDRQSIYPDHIKMYDFTLEAALKMRIYAQINPQINEIANRNTIGLFTY
jgi:hypothetical protein